MAGGHVQTRTFAETGSRPVASAGASAVLLITRPSVPRIWRSLLQGIAEAPALRRQLVDELRQHVASPRWQTSAQRCRSTAARRRSTTCRTSRRADGAVAETDPRINASCPTTRPAQGRQRALRAHSTGYAARFNNDTTRASTSRPARVQRPSMSSTSTFVAQRSGRVPRAGTAARRGASGGPEVGLLWRGGSLSARTGCNLGPTHQSVVRAGTRPGRSARPLQHQLNTRKPMANTPGHRSSFRSGSRRDLAEGVWRQTGDDQPMPLSM